MKKLLTILAACAIMLSCSSARDAASSAGVNIPTPNSTPTARSTSHPSGAPITADGPYCAVMIMKAQSSKTDVKGSWDCLSPTLQADLSQSTVDDAGNVVPGRTGDAVLTVGPGVNVIWKYVGAGLDGSYDYSLRVVQGKKVVGVTFVFYMTPEGLVDHWDYSQVETL